MTDTLYTILIAIILILFVLAYWIGQLYKVVKWIITHVHVVSPKEAKDPDYVKVKQFFGIEDDKEPGE